MPPRLTRARNRCKNAESGALRWFPSFGRQLGSHFSRPGPRRSWRPGHAGHEDRAYRGAIPRPYGQARAVWEVASACRPRHRVESTPLSPRCAGKANPGLMGERKTPRGGTVAAAHTAPLREPGPWGRLKLWQARSGAGAAWATVGRANARQATDIAPVSARWAASRGGSKYPNVARP